MDELIFKELFDTVCGEKIGQGMSRTVFECKINDKFVIKVEEPGDFQNVKEYHNWQDFQFTKGVSEWLAPCHSISDNGRILIQERCEPIGRNQLPDKMPKFITDTKVQNFGLLNNKIVCLDYSFMVSHVELVERKVEWK